jgi:muramoyltetrapeptide carboxypeptidase LdcA involved in peptidoglycan recycling
MHARLDAAIEVLLTRGLRVSEGANLRSQVKGASASAEDRAAELARVLAEPSIAAVAPPWGGERAIEILRLMDFEGLARSEPKWLIGFSDISTIQVPLLLRSGWASLHCPNLMQLPAPEFDTVSARVFDAWGLGSGGCFSQNPSRASRSWRLDGGTSAVRFSGRLIGGCLDSISRLAGTEFGTVTDFARSHSADGTVVFLENAELKPFELARALHGLRLAGWFEGASGVLIGRDAGASSAAGSEFDARDALLGALGDLPCPVIAHVDIGHVGPQWSLVQGAIARVDWRDGSCSIEQELR